MLEFIFAAVLIFSIFFVIRFFTLQDDKEAFSPLEEKAKKINNIVLKSVIVLNPTWRSFLSHPDPSLLVVTSNELILLSNKDKEISISKEQINSITTSLLFPLPPINKISVELKNKDTYHLTSYLLGFTGRAQSEIAKNTEKLAKNLSDWLIQ